MEVEVHFMAVEVHSSTYFESKHLTGELERCFVFYFPLARTIFVLYLGANASALACTILSSVWTQYLLPVNVKLPLKLPFMGLDPITKCLELNPHHA
jgi:hypothetical protein